MQGDAYPLLFSAIRNDVLRQRFAEYVDDLAAAEAAGSIRNVDLQNCKSFLSRVIDDAWSRRVREPYFNAGRWEALPKNVLEWSYGINVSGLHSLIATDRRLAKTTLQHGVISAMRGVTREGLPLALQVQGLKDKVVKGRAPSSGPATPENPDKVVRTCACCFRRIAVSDGHMAHHGYQRPGRGYQTASCAGVRFPPLERSDEGLRWLLEQVKGYHVSLQESLAGFDQRKTLTVRRGRAETVVKRDDPTWDTEARRWLREMEGEIASTDREIANLSRMLSLWTPTEALT